MNGRALPVIGWWAGFWIGPFAGLIPYLGAGEDPVARAHGKASMIFWAAVLAVWAPLILILFFSGEVETSTPLIAGLAVVFLVSLGFCMVGTVQALRGCSLSGRPIA